MSAWALLQNGFYVGCVLLRIGRCVVRQHVANRHLVRAPFPLGAFVRMSVFFVVFSRVYELPKSLDQATHVLCGPAMASEVTVSIFYCRRWWLWWCALSRLWWPWGRGGASVGGGRCGVDAEGKRLLYD